MEDPAVLLDELNALKDENILLLEQLGQKRLEIEELQNSAPEEHQKLKREFQYLKDNLGLSSAKQVVEKVKSLQKSLDVEVTNRMEISERLEAVQSEKGRGTSSSSGMVRKRISNLIFDKKNLYSSIKKNPNMREEEH